MYKFMELDSKIVNLSKTATIIFNKRKRQVIFNFSNAINILGRETSDFYIQELNTDYDFDKLKNKLLNIDFVKENFLIHESQNEIVNKNHINTITFEPGKVNKIIFNLDFGVDVKDYKTGDIIKISKFVYWRFKEEDDMYDVYQEVKKEILGE